ncbi:MAG: hypothetical protein WC578_00820 [Candidatus Omnitrophota bacterium]|jgi:hypothetical protein
MKTKICLGIVSFILAKSLFAGICFAQQEPLETIIYDVKPLGIGTCEYQDFGPTEYRGQKAQLTIFKTDVAGFKDKEVILSEAGSYLPILVQRDISIWLHDENITEEYSIRQNSFKLTKFKGGKKVEEYTVKGSKPIQNAILVPFSLRGALELKVGSTFDVVLPAEYTVKLISIEEISIPAGKFRTYHFTSKPEKFEIWISADDLRIPVKIKGLGGIPYTLEMKRRFTKQR